MAIAVAQACNAKQLVLFHHEPNYDDATIAEIEANAQKLFPKTFAAYEGLELKI
jgi:ribonuclease BN (tRNA processing enzyme)